MKKRHNKKRNTAFLYEALVRELTKSIVKKNEKKKSQIIAIVKEHFSHGSALKQDLDLYKEIYNSSELSEHNAEKLIFEVKQKKLGINKKKLFTEQSALIGRMNKQLSKSVFANFVPNYKNLAAIYNMFDEEYSIKSKILLEEKLVKNLSSNHIERKSENLKPIDDLTYGTFVSKFNKEYKSELTTEQCNLLSKYISSFKDNGLELKIFLNEELERLKGVISESQEMAEIKEDTEMLNKTSRVLEMVNNFKEQEINSKFLNKVLKIQDLVKEISA